jgi:hypothetical protein
MALKISIDAFVSGGFTNPVRWDLYEAATGVLVDSHTEAGPHGVDYNFSFVDGIRDIVYKIKFYDVPSGAGIGNLIKSHDVTPSTQTLVFDTDIELIVDGGETYDPASGTNSVVVPATIGKDFYVVQRSIGQLRAERDVEVVPDTVNGGFTLTGVQTFNEGDTFFIKFRPALSVNPAGTEPGSTHYKDVVLITADTILTSLDFGKLLKVDGASAVVTITLPPIADTIAKRSLFIHSIGTTHNNVVIKAAVGETITALGEASNTFILGKAEEAEIIKLESVFYGSTSSADRKRVAQFDLANTTSLVNRLFADGSEYSCADYPSLKKAMDDGKCTVVDYTTWAATTTIDGVVVPINKGFFALSGDQLFFKVPDLRNKFLRAITGVEDTDRLSQGAGGYQHHQVFAHGHSIKTTNSSASAGDAWDPVRGSNTGSANTRGAAGANNTIGTYGGTETRSVNIGQIPLVIF